MQKTFIIETIKKYRKCPALVSVNPFLSTGQFLALKLIVLIKCLMFYSSESCFLFLYVLKCIY